MTAILYAKVGGIAALVVLIFGLGYHFGGMAPRAALEADRAAQSEAATKALLAQRAAAADQAITDHIAETAHAQDLSTLDALTPVRTPLVVYRGAAAVCGRAVPGATPKAGGQPADPQGGRADPGSGVDIRAALDALELKYERVLADYRQLDAEWPR